MTIIGIIFMMIVLVVLAAFLIYHGMNSAISARLTMDSHLFTIAVITVLIGLAFIGIVLKLLHYLIFVI